MMSKMMDDWLTNQVKIRDKEIKDLNDCKNCKNFIESNGKYYCDTHLDPGIVEIEPSGCGNCGLYEEIEE